MDLTYFGKGPDFIKCFKIPDTIILPRHWPTEKDQLSILLRNCRYFFTWDSVSGTNYDALLCGAVPVVLHNLQSSKDSRDRFELGALPDTTLLDFGNKETVIGDFNSINNVIQETQSKFQYMKNSWPNNVKNFAVNIHKFFNVAE